MKKYAVFGTNLVRRRSRCQDETSSICPDPGLNLAVSDTRWVPNVSSPSIRPDPGVDLHKLQETNTLSPSRHLRMKWAYDNDDELKIPRHPRVNSGCGRSRPQHDGRKEESTSITRDDQDYRLLDLFESRLGRITEKSTLKQRRSARRRGFRFSEKQRWRPQSTFYWIFKVAIRRRRWRRRLRRLSNTRMPRLRDSGKPDPAIRAASAVLAGPAFFPGKRSNQPHFGRRSNGIPLAIAIMHAWMKRRLRRVLERRHTLYPPVSRLLLSDYRLLNVYGVMWPRRPGFFSGKRYSIILPSNSVGPRFGFDGF
ncbi:hypothetical protein BDZ89DRAFT_1053250 [Hymenopellis radicata]|nr:hypothetical protein BDZ89DRAFT_1053250 [Hymenopellis radicata]